MIASVMANEASGTSKTSAFLDGPKAYPRQLLRKRELASILGVSERKIDDWLAKKVIPQLRLSARLTRFDLAKVLAALARYEVKEVGAVR